MRPFLLPILGTFAAGVALAQAWLRNPLARLAEDDVSA
jgi:hypothetical protein